MEKRTEFDCNRLAKKVEKYNMDGKIDNYAYSNLTKMINMQTPQPPNNIRTKNDKRTGDCPACGHRMSNAFTEQYLYCEICGQLIDWEG